jgi:ubiquitin carboxyl-terminal hydrolase 1
MITHVFKGLSSLRSLPGFLRRLQPNPNSTNGSLLGIMEKLNDPLSNGRHFWLPDKLKSMSTWQQQDAQEYYSKVIDQLDREAVQSLRKLEAGSHSILADFAEKDIPNAGQSQTESESLRNPLEGMLAQRVGCTRCGYSEGLSLIPFNCLTVPLGNNYMYDVRDCLDEYTKLEQIDGVECPKCTLLRAEKQLIAILKKPDAPETFLDGVRSRLHIVTEALHDEDFSDNTIIKKCQIPKKHWISSTKSKQAVIARPPQSLAIHVNRSLFNELTGAQTKNNANVQFPLSFDLSYWCLGNRSGSDNCEDFIEDWSMTPTQSMLPSDEEAEIPSACNYELRAVVTHYGRHENGHYICYRKRLHPQVQRDPENVDEAPNDTDLKLEHDPESWWQLSDEDVNVASEGTVLRQGGVFMLFYERIDQSSTSKPLGSADTPLAADSLSSLDLPVDALMAAGIPLPDDDSDDLDDLLDHFEPVPQAFASRKCISGEPSLGPPVSETEESTISAQSTPSTPFTPPSPQKMSKFPTDYPTPPPSADEAEGGSMDYSDTEDSASTSFHDKAAGHADTSNAARVGTSPTDRVRMRTSGLGSKFGPEDHALQTGSRMVTAT